MDTEENKIGPENEGLTLGECLAYSGRMVRWETTGRNYWLGGMVKPAAGVVGGHLVAITPTDQAGLEWANPACLSLVVEQ